LRVYTAVPRTADVVARYRAWSCASAGHREGTEAEEPQLAAALHRWFATTLAERLTDRMRALDTLLD
jgi:hypothetical protein